jgi:hypothetical protein
MDGYDGGVDVGTDGNEMERTALSDHPSRGELGAWQEEVIIG